MRLAFPLLACLFGGCAVPFSDVDGALRGEGIRTVAVEEHFTLYAPYELGRTQELARMIDENLRAVTDALGSGLDEPIQVHARAIEMQGLELEVDGDSIRYSGAIVPPTVHDVAGYAARYEPGEPPTIVFFVAADKRPTAENGEAIVHTFGFDYSGIVRHELAHLISSAFLPDGPTWFDEGLALEMEYARPRDGRLVPDPDPLTIRLARVEQAQHRLAELLDWREDGRAILKGEETPFETGRPLAHAYMRFLLERGGGDRSVAAFQAIFAMEREEHLALETEWRRWLEAKSGASEGLPQGGPEKPQRRGHHQQPDEDAVAQTALGS